MNMKNVSIIYHKDLREIMTLRTVKYSMIIFPVLFLSILLFILYFSYLNLGSSSNIPDYFNNTLKAVPYSSNGKIFYYLSMNYLIFLSIVPLSLASTISSYSVVGEKQQKTIEPILATPIDDREFFLGKLLAPLFPTLGITYVVIAIYSIFSDLISIHFNYIIYPNISWAIVVFLFIPFSTILMVLLTLLFSSKAVDPRSSQQFSAIILIPILVVFFLSMLIYSIESILLLLLTAIVIIGDFLLFRITVKIFDRETIVTRWK
ncbi:MAG: ABC transporter permease subunit [Thermoplasmata archaeon]|nr:ABC transporter permease subunit [Thermoplasmata archaeon]